MTLIDQHEVELFFERYFEDPMRPDGESWGFFVEDRDPAPPKVAYFLWFRSQMESIQFLDKFPLFISSGDATEKQIHDVRAMHSFAIGERTQTDPKTRDFGLSFV